MSAAETLKELSDALGSAIDAADWDRAAELARARRLVLERVVAYGVRDAATMESLQLDVGEELRAARAARDETGQGLEQARVGRVARDAYAKQSTGT